MVGSSAKPLPGITVTVPFGNEPDWRFGTQPLPYTSKNAERFLTKLIQEIQTRSKTYRKNIFSTVYFGGCGPSCLTLDQLYRILQTLYDHLAIQPEEQTLVILPNTVDAARAKVLRESGFDQMTLRVGATARTLPDQEFLLLRDAGFSSVGFELPATIPLETFHHLLDLKPDHLTFYPPPNPNPAEEKLTPDYHHFLPGHFALPGKENRHLLKLSTDQPVIGFGPGAITRTGKKQSQNPTQFDHYCKNC